MIFVTFGNVPIPFTRLASKIDELSSELTEEFIVQAGYTNYSFSRAVSTQFLSASEMSVYIDKASVVITHGGYGTISECLKKGKRIVAVPRLAGEHNHSQEELIRALEVQGFLIGVYNIAELEAAIDRAKSFSVKPVSRNSVSVIINDFIMHNI